MGRGEGLGFASFECSGFSIEAGAQAELLGCSRLLSHRAGRPVGVSGISRFRVYGACGLAGLGSGLQLLPSCKNGCKCAAGAL